jgi:hypothetical protein
LIEEMAAEMGLNRMGEDDDEDSDEDDDKGDATKNTTTAAPEVATKEEEDPEMLILEQESPEALLIILPNEEPELLQPRLYTKLIRDHEESPSRENDDLDHPTLDDYDEYECYPGEDD